MTTAKHTPGPWVLEGAIIRADDRPVCEIYREFTSSPATLANAQLIAAAPDLLAALLKAQNFIENTEGEMGEPLPCGDAARAAIAKATA